jgi:hypothetical protein
MKIAETVFIIIHLLSIAGIVILLLTQAGKVEKVVPKGLTHAGLTALVAGLALVGIREGQHHQHPMDPSYAVYNYGTIATKLVVLVVILALAFKHSKAESISRGTWVILLGLTVLNIGLAGTLK